jgi:hypothetical protein
MTEAAGGGRTEVERRLVERSLQDEDFRQRLLDDPRGTLEQELGRGLPEGVEVRAVEESADTIYLVLPSASRVGQVGEVTDRELEAVAGGEDSTSNANEWSCICRRITLLPSRRRCWRDRHGHPNQLRRRPRRLTPVHQAGEPRRRRQRKGQSRYSKAHY